MRIEVNLDEVSSDIEAMPAGNYSVKVTRGDLKPGKVGDFIAWELTVSDGKFEGRKLFTNTSLAVQSLWNMKRFLEACGFEWDPDGFNTEDVLGSELEVVVSQEEYQERVRNKVDDFLPL